jgi:hypothetical protein
MTTIRRHAAQIATAGLVLVAGAAFAGTSHADTSQLTDACLDGHTTTVIMGVPCAPGTPTASQVCRTGQAHMTLGADYCPPPKVVIVGEYQLGTVYVPTLAAPTRLNVAMAPKGTTTAKRARCANLGGGNLTWSKKARVWVCHNVTF